MLNNPTGLCFDPLGNLYIADYSNHVVRMVNSSGIISTLAGIGGSNGYSGDGAAAVAALLTTPAGLCADSSGNIYIADAGNNVIRMVDSSGIINTIAGTGGSSGYSGDGAAAALALLTTPNDICLDSSGNIYIADTGNNVIRKIANSTGFISTFAGTGALGYTGDAGLATSATLSGPESLCLDSAGNLFISDTGNNVIRKIIASTGIITTFAGTGVSDYTGDGHVPLSATFNTPRQIFVDASTNVFIADSSNNVIRKLTSPKTTYLTGTDTNNAETPRLDIIEIGGAGSFSGYTLPSANTRAINITLTQTGPLGAANDAVCGTATFPSTLTQLQITGDATNFDVVSTITSAYQLPTPPSICSIRFILNASPSNACKWFQAAVPSSCNIYVQPQSADPKFSSGILDVPCNIIVGYGVSLTIPSTTPTVNSIIQTYTTAAHPTLVLKGNTVFASAVKGVSLSGAYTATFDQTSNIYNPTLTGTNKISGLIVGNSAILTVYSAGVFALLPVSLSSASAKINISGENP